MALPVKDGSGVLTSLKTTLTGSDHMPHHIVEAVSGTVVVTSSASSPIYVTSSNAMTVTASSTNPVAVRLQTNALSLGSGLPVTASSAYPVYVTGAVSISQPVSVDVVVGDNIFVTSSITAPLYISSSANSPVLVTGTVNVNNYPSITTVTASTNNPLSVTGTINVNNYPAVTTVTASINNPLPITGTVSLTNVNITASLSNNAITASFQNPVAVTGAFGISSSISNPVFVELGGITKYAFSSGSALITKITGSGESDRLWVTGNVDIGITKYGYPEGAALVVKTTSSTVTLEGINTIFSSIGTPTTGVAVGLIGQDNSVRLYNSTSSVTSSQTFPLYVTGSVYSSLIDNTVRVSSSSGERVWVTGSVTSTTSVTVSDGLKVELSGTNVKQVSGSSANTYLQTSIAPVATGSALKTFAPPNWGGSVPSGDPNVIIFDWSVASGTVNAASSSINRKSLTFFNDSPHNVYIMMGEPIGGNEQTNGFNIYQVSSKPNFYSFVLYPSGTYFAEPHNVGMKHGMFLVSSSVSSETRIFITETY